MTLAPRLADQWGLLEGDEDRAHAGHVFGLLAGLGVEVAEPGHPLPLGAGVVLVQVGNHGLLSRPAREPGKGREREERTWDGRAVSEGRGQADRTCTCSPEKILC